MLICLKRLQYYKKNITFATQTPYYFIQEMKRILFLLTALLCLFAVSGNAQNVKEINLWPYGAPNKNGDPRDSAKVWVYIPDRKVATGRAIVICPGGGYDHLALDKEGKEWGKFFQNIGICAVVLKYRMPHGHYEVPIVDAEEAIRLVRRNAASWHVDVKNVMVMGGGKTAVRVLKSLPDYMEAKVIETDEKRCEYLNNVLDTDRIMVINGDGRDISLLIEENIKSTQAFVALTGSAEANILACLTSKRLGVRKTAAMVENLDYVNMAEGLDIGTIVNKKALAASHIYQMMLDADVQNMRFLMTANADVIEFTAQQGSKVTRKKVFELGLPNGMTIGGLVRHGVGQLVSGGTQIETGDTVVVFCHEVNMKKVESFFK